MFHTIHKPATFVQNSWLNPKTAKTKPLPILRAAATNSKLQKTTKAIITFIAACFEDSNIHGLQYVVKGGLTKIEK